MITSQLLAVGSEGWQKQVNEYEQVYHPGECLCPPASEVLWVSGKGVGLGGAPEKVGWEQRFKDEGGFLPSRSSGIEKKETCSKGGMTGVGHILN